MTRQEQVAYLTGLIDLMEFTSSMGSTDRDPRLIAEFNTTYEAFVNDLEAPAEKEQEHE